MDSRLTQEILSTLFYIKDDELYWKERDQKDFERSVVCKERLKYIQELEMEYKNLVDDRVFPAIYELNKSW